MKLFHIKLTNGDELISQTEVVLSSEGDKLYLVNPLILQDVMDKDSGQCAIILHDWVPFNTNKNKVELNEDHIVSKSAVDNSMIEYYKVSLEYCMLFAAKEASEKISNAAAHLNSFIKQEVSKAFTIPTDTTSELYDYVDEEDLDEYTLDSITSSNTTYH